MGARFERFDVLRGCAILAVVLIHITAPLATGGNVFSIIVNQISRFAVPVFFILSGWGLTISESYEKSAGYLDFLWGRFVGIFPQYLLWNFIYLAYSDVWHVQSLGEFVRALLLGTIFNHLYFVPVILALYVVYPLLLKFATRRGLLVSLGITLASQLSEVWIQHEIFAMNRNIFNWIFFFMFGIWLARDFENYVARLQKYRPFIYAGLLLSMALVILTPFLIGDTFDFNLTLASTRPTVIAYSLMVLLSAIVFRGEIKALSAFMLLLGKHSFYIYLNHYLFLSLFREVVDTSWLPAPVYIALSLLVVLFLSFVTSWLLSKLDAKI